MNAFLVVCNVAALFALLAIVRWGQWERRGRLVAEGRCAGLARRVARAEAHNDWLANEWSTQIREKQRAKAELTALRRSNGLPRVPEIAVSVDRWDFDASVRYSPNGVDLSGSMTRRSLRLTNGRSRRLEGGSR